MSGTPRPNMAVVATGLAVAFSLFGDMAMYVILPAQNAALALGALQVGLLLSANRWIRLATNQFAQRLIRRRGVRIAFPTALAVGSLLAVGYAVAPSFAVLLVLRMAWGACWSVIRHTGAMTAAGAGEPGRSGRSMGVYLALVNFGFVAGTFVAGWLYDFLGYRQAFFLAAALSLAALPAAFIARRCRGVSSRPPFATAPEPGSETDDDPETSLVDGRLGEPEAGKELELEASGFTLRVRGFIVSLVASGLVMSTLGFMLKERYGENVTIARASIGITALTGMLLSTRSVVNLAGSPFAGILLDHRGPGGTLRIGFASSGIALLAASAFESTAVMIPLVVVFFIGAMIARLAVESQAAQRGHRSYAALATATDLGSAVGPMLGWLGIELARSGSVLWIGGALLLAASCLRR